MHRAREERWLCCYIMASRWRNLYAGVTSRPEKRVWEHKNGVFKGFTSRYNITRLVYFEGFGDIRSAIDREKQVKRWSRKKKLALIENLNPTWLDLGEGWQENAGPSTRRRIVSQIGRAHV